MVESDFGKNIRARISLIDTTDKRQHPAAI